MASRPPLISNNLFYKCSLLWLFLLGGCQADTPPLEERNVSSTYVLAIVDTAQGEPAWLVQYRANLPDHTTLAVSGYSYIPAEWFPNGCSGGHKVQEQCFALLSRVPWLLQPGVDTLYLGVPSDCSARLCDSVALWSPSTHCVPRVGIK